MKKSLPILILVLNTSLFADILTETTNKTNFYLGAGSAFVNSNNVKVDSTKLTFLGGYSFNKYLGIEGRYSFNNGNNTDIWSIFVKPKYPILNNLNLYGLIGYGGIKVPPHQKEDVQFGLGAEYSLSPNIGVYADYTTVYDDKIFDYVDEYSDFKVDVNNVNIGVKYFF